VRHVALVWRYLFHARTQRDLTSERGRSGALLYATRRAWRCVPPSSSAACAAKPLHPPTPRSARRPDPAPVSMRSDRVRVARTVGVDSDHERHEDAHDGEPDTGVRAHAARTATTRVLGSISCFAPWLIGTCRTQHELQGRSAVGLPRGDGGQFGSQSYSRSTGGDGTWREAHEAVGDPETAC